MLLRLRQEEFVITSGRIEKPKRLSTEKEARECMKLRLSSLVFDQVFVDKPPPNRVLPYVCDAAPEGIIASRVLYYQWFPCDLQLLVVSVLKAFKSNDAYDKAMLDSQTPAFVSLIASVRLFRVDATTKKGRPALVVLVSDVISIKWPNLAMQERSRRALAQHMSSTAAAASAATPRSGFSRQFSAGSVGGDSYSSPLSPDPHSPSPFASNASALS
jgi:hypothetical protein